MTGPLTILQGDAAEMLKTIPSESVQLCATSPPYDNLRSYGAGFKWNFPLIAQELFRVLCKGGVMCWNVGDEVVKGSETLTSMRQALHFVDAVGFKMHDTMIYAKCNFSHPEKARYHQIFEYVFILAKGAPKTFNPIKDKPNIYAGQRGGFGINTYTERDGSKSLRNIKHNFVNEFGMRGNVWYGNTAGQENPCAKLDHPAMMPEWLAKDLVSSWSNVGDMVMDPFFGSGTTGLAALGLGRNCIGIELNPDYIEMAKARCNVTQGLALK